MAFDPEIHHEHPDTGLHIDKRTGFPAGLAPLPIARVNHDDEYPKWVVPHSGHGRGPFPTWDRHVNRDNGELMVLVPDEAEELRALTEPPAAE